MKKTIILINQYSAEPKYSMGRRYQDWARFLAKDGHKVYMVCGPTDEIPSIAENGGYKDGYCLVQDEGVNYVYIETPSYKGNGISRIQNMFAFFNTTNKVLPKLPKPDVIIGRSPNPLTCISGIKYGKKHRVPVVSDIVDLWPESIVVYMHKSASSPLMKLLYRGEKWIYEKSNAVIFSDAGDYDYIIEKGWERTIPREKCFYINMGVNVSDFDYNRDHFTLDDPKMMREDLFKVAYTGSVSTVNHLRTLVDAGRIIQEKGIKDVYIMIHGSGTQVDELRSYCKEKGIENVALFGRIEKNQIPYVLSNADICVLCYQNTPLLRFGGSMNKMFEYFASGKPVITNVKMGHSQIVEYNCGEELDSNDPEVLANAILKYKEMSKEERVKLGENSRRAAEDYDIHNLYAKLLGVIDYVTIDAGKVK